MTHRPPLVLATLLLSLLPVAAAAQSQQKGAGFEPLITSANLEHLLGGKNAWSFENSVLRGRVPGGDAQRIQLLTAERFGNFTLRFSARVTGGKAAVVFRTAQPPPGFLVGYKTVVAGEGPGSLVWLKRPSFAQMAARFRQGGAPAAEEVPLAPSKHTADPQRWVDYKISALGDRFLIEVDQQVVAHYRHPEGPPEGALAFVVEGPDAGVEFKDLQIQLTGKVHWASDVPEGPIGSSDDRGKTDPPPFQRMTADRWTQESRELLELARRDEGFRPLFEGGRGWEDTSRSFSVEDGVITGQSRNSFLVTNDDYSDFILKASVRLNPPTGNSGIQVRSTVTPEGMQGYQIDMAVFAMGEARIPWWGMIYHEGTERGILYPVEDRPKRLALVRDGDWNDVVIICKGHHLLAMLNGEVTADLVDNYGATSGRIGFQLHVGPAMKVEFRDIRIKPL